MRQCEWIEDGTHTTSTKARKHTVVSTLDVSGRGPIWIWTLPPDEALTPKPFWIHTCPDRWVFRTSIHWIHVDTATLNAGDGRQYLFGQACFKVRDPECLPPHDGFSWGCLNGDLEPEDSLRVLAVVAPTLDIALASPSQRRDGEIRSLISSAIRARQDVERTLDIYRNPSKSKNHARNLEMVERVYRKAEELGLSRAQLDLGARLCGDSVSMEDVSAVIEALT